MHALIWPCQEGDLKILPFVVEGALRVSASEASGMRRTISDSQEHAFLRAIPRDGTVSHHTPPALLGRQRPLRVGAPTWPPAKQPTRLPTSQGGRGTNEPAHDGTGNNLKPWEIANQRVEGISPASDQVVLASRFREKPVAPDEPVPWFRGTMVTNEPKTPVVLETMIPGLHRQLGSEEKMALKPAGAPWEVETMERRVIVPMTQVTPNTIWYQDRSRPRSQDAQEPG